MRNRLPLAIVFGIVGGCAGGLLIGKRLTIVAFTVFALTTGFSAFIIPDNDRSMKLVLRRTVSCALGGGLLMAALSGGFYLSHCALVGAGVAAIIAPFAVIITRVQEWVKAVRENSTLGGFRRAAIAMTLLGFLAVCPWEVFRPERFAPSDSALRRLALVLVAAVALPALAIAMHAVVVARGVRAIEKVFAGARSASLRGTMRIAESGFDIGVGATGRVTIGATQPYRHQPATAVYCVGDGRKACSMLRMLSYSGALVALAALLHAALLISQISMLI